ncbi:MAG: type I methionyl aminopeptidase [Spirochaetales bacterium]|nr:type I methionyl aminopeptidase [Spirochaetales bacterium]
MFEQDIHIPLKTSVDVARIRRSCRIVEKVLRNLAVYVRKGTTTAELDTLAEQMIKKNGGHPALKDYNGFPASICTSVNHVAAHGLPSDYALDDGDIVTIDTTISIDGWYGDGAWTFCVGALRPDTKRVIRAAWQSSLAGIMAIRPGGYIGDIGFSIQAIALKHGCSIVQEYVGHGIGQKMHEDPRIPNIGAKGTGMRIVPGMVFTIEPLISIGNPEVTITEDGWSIVTCDNSLTAQFEHTVAVFRDRIEILTLSVGNMKENVDYPPYFL